MAEISTIINTEVSDQFIQGMKDRMVVSYHKYGPLINAYPHKVNALASLQQRLEKYAQTGNTEYLIDAANFAMIEFMHPRHSNAHFEGTDDSGSPGRIALKTGQVDKRDNSEIGKNHISELAKFRD